MKRIDFNADKMPNGKFGLSQNFGVFTWIKTSREQIKFKKIMIWFSSFLVWSKTKEKKSVTCWDTTKTYQNVQEKRTRPENFYYWMSFSLDECDDGNTATVQINLFVIFSRWRANMNHSYAHSLALFASVYACLCVCFLPSDNLHLSFFTD